MILTVTLQYVDTMVPVQIPGPQELRRRINVDPGVILQDLAVIPDAQHHLIIPKIDAADAWPSCPETFQRVPVFPAELQRDGFPRMNETPSPKGGVDWTCFQPG